MKSYSMKWVIPSCTVADKYLMNEDVEEGLASGLGSVGGRLAVVWLEWHKWPRVEVTGLDDGRDDQRVAHYIEQWVQ